jgi:hypothetical protein
VKRITAILTIASLISCISFLILLPISESLSLVKLQDHGHAVVPDASFAIGTYHCEVSRGRIWFFNDDYPYTGSIITFEGLWGGKKATPRTDWSWVISRYGIEQVSHIDDKGQSVGKERYSDLPGVYFRYFEWTDVPRPWWTLRVSLWYPIALSAVLPSWWLIGKMRCRRKKTAQA